MSSERDTKKRKYIRFTADLNTTIWVSKDLKNFQEDFLGLVDEESHGGSGFTINQDIGISEGDFLLVKVGNLHAMMAEVRWCRKFSDDLFQYGLMYIE